MTTRLVTDPVKDDDRRRVLARRIRFLVAATIAYNVIEAVVAITAGSVASSSALVGFGLDSVIEVASAVAVAWQFTGEDPQSRLARPDDHRALADQAAQPQAVVGAHPEFFDADRAGGQVRARGVECGRPSQPQYLQAVTPILLLEQQGVRRATALTGHEATQPAPSGNRTTAVLDPGSKGRREGSDSARPGALLDQ